RAYFRMRRSSRARKAFLKRQRVKLKALQLAAACTVKPRTADLAVSVTDAPDPVQPGSQLPYTVTVTNLGPATVDEIALVVELPFSTEVVGGTPAEALCAAQPLT